MNRIPQVVHTWLFGEMPLRQIIKNVSLTGLDGIDLSILYQGENSAQNLLKLDVIGMLRDYGLRAYACTPMYWERVLNLCDDDISIRETAIDFTKTCIDVAVHCGCDRLLVSASQVSLAHKRSTCLAKAWEQGIHSMRVICKYAQDCGLFLMLEPINRYMTSLVHTISEAHRMIHDVAINNLYMVPDIFHICIEEDMGICDALKQAGKDMLCLHVATNTRKVPGSNHFDWLPIMQTLYEIGFTGPLSHEPVSLYFDHRKVAEDHTALQLLLNNLSCGNKHLDNLMDCMHGIL